MVFHTDLEKKIILIVLVSISGLLVACSDETLQPSDTPTEAGSVDVSKTVPLTEEDSVRPVPTLVIAEPADTVISDDLLISPVATWPLVLNVNPTPVFTPTLSPNSPVPETNPTPSLVDDESITPTPIRVIVNPTSTSNPNDQSNSPTPASTLTPSTTPTAAQTPAPTPTLQPPSEFPTPRPTSTPVATPHPTSTPVPTAIPNPVADDRYGVIASGDGLGWQLETLGVKWFIDYRSDPRGAPEGTSRVPFISVKPGRERISPELMAEYAAGVPGSYWYIGGETNVAAQDGISPADYVVEFDYYVELILEADPTAKILGPSVLNWDFSCTGCSWNSPGKYWLPEFISEYALAHGGATPPIDAWAIDAYPLTWLATPEYPNPLPMTEWELAMDQIVGLREYLEDNVPAHSDTPIWVTEMASHWAYDTLGFESDTLMTLITRSNC